MAWTTLRAYTSNVLHLVLIIVALPSKSAQKANLNCAWRKPLTALLSDMGAGTCWWSSPQVGSHIFMSSIALLSPCCVEVSMLLPDKDWSLTFQDLPFAHRIVSSIVGFPQGHMWIGSSGIRLYIPQVFERTHRLQKAQLIWTSHRRNRISSLIYDVITFQFGVDLKTFNSVAAHTR